MSRMPFVHDDGGRAAAGYRGGARDCVARSIAIATGLPYQQVYDGLNEAGKGERRGSRKSGVSSARAGVYKATIHRYLTSLGWQWRPTMRIGSGCTVHLAPGELPDGRLIVSLSKHYTAVVDGTVHDTHDPQRATLVYENGEHIRTAQRCVYGYWSAAPQQGGGA